MFGQVRLDGFALSRPPNLTALDVVPFGATCRRHDQTKLGSALGDPATDEFGDAIVIGKFGDAPGV
jgi:hypothetical protein